MTNKITCKTLWVLDPLAFDKLGHCYHYNLAILKECRLRNQPVQICVHRKADDDLVEELIAKRMFRHRTLDTVVKLPVFGNIVNTIALNLSILLDLRKLKFEKGDMAFFPTVTHSQFAGIVLWWRLMGPLRRNVTVSCLFRLQVPESGSKMGRFTKLAYQTGFHLLRKWGGECFRLVTDANTLSAEWARFSGFPFSTLPIPHGTETAITTAHSDFLPPIHFLYIGRASASKGYNLLPSAIREALKRNPSLRFTIQSTGAAGGCDFLRATRSDLLNFGESVKSFDQALTATEYDAMISECDAVLLPYVAPEYRTQTSGIFCDALSHGKSVIYTSNTWMADEIAQFDPSMPLMTKPDAEHIAEAIVDFASRPDYFSTFFRKMAARWCRYHTQSNFLSTLLGRADAILPHSFKPESCHVETY